MKTKIIIFSLLLFLFTNSKGQNPDFENDIIQPPPFSPAINCQNSSPDYYNYYNNAFNIPKLNDNTKIIKINFNIFRDDNGAGNFQTPIQDGGADLTRLNNIFDFLRTHYIQNVNNSDPPSGITVNDLSHTYIDFELGGIYFTMMTIYITQIKDLY